MNKEINKYKVLTLIRYLGDGLFYPFFALYLKSTGILEGKLGLLLSLSPMLSIIFNPIYSKICKNPTITKNVLMVITILEAIVILFIPFFSNFYTLLILTILLGIFGSCHYGLLDALSTMFADVEGINYSSIRVFGSIAYIIATSIGGIICDESFKVCFILAAGLFVLSGVFYHLLMPIKLSSNKKEVKTETQSSLITLLKNKNFILIVILHLLLQGVTKTADNFFPTYLETRGVGSTTYGFVYAYFVIAEVVSLIVLNRFVKLNKNPYLLFSISSLLLFIRLLCNCLYLPVPVIIAISSFRGIGYAIMLHLMYQYITLVVDKKDSTKAIMFNTLVYSIFLFICSNVSGYLIEVISYQMFYLINSILALIVVVYALVIYIIKRKNESNETQLLKNKQ